MLAGQRGGLLQRPGKEDTPNFDWSMLKSNSYFLPKCISNSSTPIIKPHYQLLRAKILESSLTSSFLTQPTPTPMGFALEYL